MVYAGILMSEPLAPGTIVVVDFPNCAKLATVDGFCSKRTNPIYVKVVFWNFKRNRPQYAAVPIDAVRRYQTEVISTSSAS